MLAILKLPNPVSNAVCVKTEVHDHDIIMEKPFLSEVELDTIYKENNTVPIPILLKC